MKTTLGSFALLACLGIVIDCTAQQNEKPKRILTVSQDESGDVKGSTSREIAEAIQCVVKSGGGTVKIKKGTYTIEDALTLGPEAKDVTIEGDGQVTFSLAPQVRTVTTAEAKPGGTALQVKDGARFRAGMLIEIQAPGKTDSFSGHRPKFFCTRVQSASATEIRLPKPLEYPVPAGTNVLYLLNVFQIDRAKRVSIRQITMDGNVQSEDVRPINHTYHCAVFGCGPYSYEKGPLGDPAEDVTVENCVIRNFFHRGVVLYSVVRATVANCRIENTQSEAIDFDHFCYHCTATKNSIVSAPVAVELNDASYCMIAENHIKDCEIGINVWRWCKLDNLNVENRIEANSIHGAKTYGIRCGKGADRNVIEHNMVKGGDGIGIVLEGNANVAAKNIVSGTGKAAFYVPGESMDVSGNICSDPSGKPNAVDAIFVAGHNNKIHKNIITSHKEKAFRHGVHDTGKENLVEHNICLGAAAEPVKIGEGK